MSTPFAKHTQPDGAVRWWQAVPGRYVDPGQYQLVEWLAAGGVPDQVPYVAPPPAVDPDLTEATAIMADAAAVEAVQRVVARVAAVAALGVAITDWTIQGVLDAAENAIATADAERGAIIMRHGSCLHAEWLRVIYHCRGEIVTADRLWPYLYQLAQGEH